MRWEEDEENTQKKENKVLWQGSNYFLQKTKKNLFNVCKKKMKLKTKKHKYEYEEILKTRETQNQNSF